jgi:metal-dependent hydrolase (beta-lactamase superfamily II)
VDAVAKVGLIDRYCPSYNKSERVATTPCLIAFGDRQWQAAKIVTALHDRFKVEYVAPGHCTGQPAFAALKRAFGDHYVYAGLGTTVSLDASPHQVANRL